MSDTPYESNSLDFERFSLDAQQARSEDFRSHMVRRRTVRHFSTQPVPFVLIENAVAAAASAPSGANQQPWTFVVVSDSALKQRIRAAAEAEEKESYQRRMSQDWLDAIAHLGTDWHKPHLTDAPYLIVVFRQSYGVVRDPIMGEQRVKHYYSEESAGIAVGVLLAALHWSGLATLTHTPSPMAFLSEILGRPANERPFVLIPVGYPADDARVPAITRKPLREVLVHLDGAE